MVLGIRDIERRKPNVVIKLKCNWCGKPIEKYWERLPDSDNDFCDRSCCTSFRNAGLHRIDAGKEIDRQLGIVPNYKDIPPEECQEKGRTSCLNCNRMHCIWDSKHQRKKVLV